MSKTVTVGDIPFVGDFFLLDSETEQVLFDSRKDGGDVPPLMCIAPVVSIAVHNVHKIGTCMFFIYIKTDWKGE